MDRSPKETDGSPSFDALVLAEVETIRRIGFRLLRDRQELEDFTQDTLLCVYANRSRLRDLDRLPQWVHAIARNTARMWNRKARPVLMNVLPEEADPDLTALEQLEREEHWERLVEAINALSPKDRDILFAHYFEDADYAELEAAHGLTYRAVGIRLTRARQALRLRLEHVAHGFWLFLFPPRKARGFGELPTRMHTMRPATLLTALLALAGATGASWYLAAQTFEIPVFVEEPLPRIELVENVKETPKEATPAGGGSVEGESPLVAQAPAAPFRALQAGTWTRKADLLIGRWGLEALAYRDKLYAIGGSGPFGIEEYDPTTDTWTKVADNIPESRLNFEHSVIAQIEDRIYEVEGMTEYNLTTLRLTQKTPLRTPRSHFASAVVNGKIYALGGETSKKGDDGNWITTINSAVEEYDPVTDTWTKKKDMAIGKKGGITASVDGKIYVFWSSGDIDMYDPVADTWEKRTNLPAPFAVSPFSNRAMVLNGRIYLTAGTMDTNPQLWQGAILEYDPSSDTWTKREGVPKVARRFTPGTALLKGKIYLIGGIELLPNGNWGATLRDVEVYDLGLTDLPVNPQGKLPTTLGELKTN